MNKETPHRLVLVALLASILVVQILILNRIPPPVKVGQDVRMEVDVENISQPVWVTLSDTVDVNLSEVVGRQLVESERGMYIGVNSVENTVIPINWGEVSIGR